MVSQSGTSRSRRSSLRELPSERLLEQPLLLVDVRLVAVRVHERIRITFAPSRELRVLLVEPVEDTVRADEHLDRYLARLPVGRAHVVGDVRIGLVAHV